MFKSCISITFNINTSSFHLISSHFIMYSPFRTVRKWSIDTNSEEFTCFHPWDFVEIWIHTWLPKREETELQVSWQSPTRPPSPGRNDPNDPWVLNHQGFAQDNINLRYQILVSGSDGYPLLITSYYLMDITDMTAYQHVSERDLCASFAILTVTCQFSRETTQRKPVRQHEKPEVKIVYT